MSNTVEWVLTDFFMIMFCFHIRTFWVGMCGGNLIRFAIFGSWKPNLIMLFEFVIPIFYGLWVKNLFDLNLNPVRGIGFVLTMNWRFTSTSLKSGWKPRKRGSWMTVLINYRDLLWMRKQVPYLLRKLADFDAINSSLMQTISLNQV